MKKLLFFIPFILFSCLESELIIPGENVGDPGVEVDPPTDFPILKKYVSEYAGFEYTLNFEDKYLVEYNSHVINRDENGKILSVKKGDKLYSFNYRDNIISIKQDEKTYNLEYTETEGIQYISATQLNSNIPVANYEFSTTKLKFIDEYKIQFLNDGNIIEGKTSHAKFNIKTTGANNLSVKSIFYERNGNIMVNSTFKENDKPNPIVKLSKTDYNPLILIEAFSEEKDSNTVPQLDILALLISANNRSEVTYNNETFVLNYTHRDDNYPTLAEVNKSEEKVGEVKYIYR